ncbi:MAG: carbohydrate-binding protein [Alicyclobacillus sp.]|nr:carbohydrate-binding protein [Alicyclobacillus sp.]
MKRLKSMCVMGVGTVMTLALGFTPMNTAFAFSSSDADAAMNSFVNAFWDPNMKYFYTNSDHQIHSSHAFGPMGGLYSDFWWEAQLWETVMDAYQRTGSSTYRSMIDDVYNGFTAQYPTWSDNYNDDLGWWALACARAYEITGESQYLTQSETLFNRIYQYQDSTYGGGIWWRSDATTPGTSGAEKNVATNAPAVITAVKLYQATGNSGYLNDAESLFSWLTSTLQSGGHVYDNIQGTGDGTVEKWDFSYNFGTYIGAADALYSVTNNAAYLNAAISAANWVTTYLTNGGTLRYEGVDDAGGFKMILCRYLNELVTKYGQSQYLAFLRANANEAWTHRRTSDGLIGPDWSSPAPSTYIQSFTSASGADILQVVSPDGYEGLQPENGLYEAENAVTNVNAESIYGGYTGRGYLAGWNQPGQYVTFNVNTPCAGSYEVKFHYATGAGDATREVDINGSTFNSSVTFNNTGSWSNWNTLTLNGVTLNQGYNQITVQMNGSGNMNYLNLDNMSVSAQFQAENGTLHNLQTESIYSGYTGTGYIAGWNSDGQWVDLHPNVSKAGYYDLTFRYAAGAGDASRYLYVNGAGVVNHLAFPSTGNWSSWNTVTVNNVYLNAGSNTVSLIFNSSLGSTNYLNLDEMLVRFDH